MTTDATADASTTTAPGATDTTAAATVLTDILTGTPEGTTLANTTAGEQTAKAEDGSAATLIEYEPFTVPEGMTVDEEMLGEFKAEAQRLKLSQEDAQKMASLGIKMQQKQADAYRATQEGWRESIKSDKEFGGDALLENVAVARKGLAEFGSPELEKLLADTGFGNHPEIVRAFYRIGKRISQDTHVVTGSQPGSAVSQAKRLFPNQA